LDKTHSTQAEHKEQAVNRRLISDLRGPVYKRKVVYSLEGRTIHFSAFICYTSVHFLAVCCHFSFLRPSSWFQGPPKIKVFLSTVDAHLVNSIRDYGVNETVTSRNDKLNWFN